LFGNRTVLWMILLATPFPYIATLAGWTVAEVGRQPWLIYGLDADHARMPIRASPRETACSL
jgi:cytochrome bd-type quinol oxidase subunit 1